MIGVMQPGRVLAVALGGMLLAGCGGDAGAREAPVAERPVRVTLAEPRDTVITRSVAGTGMLAAKEEVPLGFRIGGVLARVLVDEGQAVRAGQLLAELAQPEIAGQVAKAEAGAAQAERDLARAEALYRDSVIALNRVEAARTGAEVARADLQVARFTERYAAIRAPAAGVVLRRMAEPGQQLSGGTPVLLFASAARGQVVRVGLAERDVARVRVGDRATVRFATRGDAAITGRVSQVAALATPGAGTWEVEVTPAAPVAVASGLVAAVEILPARRETVRLVPLAALLEGDDDSAVVFTVSGAGAGGEGGVAHRHVVGVAFVEGEWAAVAGGLPPGEPVVVRGAAYLDEARPVVVTQEGSAP